jgi:hypothetical protein
MGTDGSCSRVMRSVWEGSGKGDSAARGSAASIAAGESMGREAQPARSRMGKQILILVNT